MLDCHDQPSPDWLRASTSTRVAWETRDGHWYWVARRINKSESNVSRCRPLRVVKMAPTFLPLPRAPQTRLESATKPALFVSDSEPPTLRINCK